MQDSLYVHDTNIFKFCRFQFIRNIEGYCEYYLKQEYDSFKLQQNFGEGHFSTFQFLELVKCDACIFRFILK